MADLKPTSMDTSTGVVVPREMLEHVKAYVGDELLAVEVPAGYLITSHDPEVESQWKIARKIMHEYEATLRILAK
jgi:hypothetical protein